jgi:hypothetical protein
MSMTQLQRISFQQKLAYHVIKFSQLAGIGGAHMSMTQLQRISFQQKLAYHVIKFSQLAGIATGWPRINNICMVQSVWN